MTISTTEKIGDILRIHIPINLKRRQSRKMIVAPDGSDITGAFTHGKDNKDYKLIKAVGKAFLWQGMLESGTYASVEQMAKALAVEITHMRKILRLTLLAPDIVESIVQGKQPRTLTLQQVIRGFPMDWAEQRNFW